MGLSRNLWVITCSYGGMCLDVVLHAQELVPYVLQSLDMVYFHFLLIFV